MGTAQPISRERTERSKRLSRQFRENLRLARVGGTLSARARSCLEALSKEFGFSMKVGDLVMIDGGWYVTHAGLVRLARRKRCQGINVEPFDSLCDSTACRFVFKAIVYPSKGSPGFVGYGDADPSNVSALVRGAEMRVAETRAVNRALRKAYGIGLCSVEELGAGDRDEEPPIAARKRPPQASNSNGNSNGSPRVRDRLCQLIRQHGLEPELVKAYAVDYCGTSSLKEASRAQVEQFVQHLADWAGRDRDALLCQLNSYPRVEQGRNQQDRPQEGAA